MRHLQANVQGRGVVGALLGQALGDAQPIDPVHPGKILGDVAGLVGLYLADEVPGEGERPQRFDLAQCFLHVAFAKLGQSATRRRLHDFGRLRLGDCEECDRVDVAAARRGSPFDAFLYPPDIFRQILRTH
jgi:hypothetical protein